MNFCTNIVLNQRALTNIFLIANAVFISSSCDYAPSNISLGFSILKFYEKQRTPLESDLLRSHSNGICHQIRFAYHQSRFVSAQDFNDFIGVRYNFKVNLMGYGQSLLIVI